MVPGSNSFVDSVTGIWRTKDGGDHWALVLPTYYDSQSASGRNPIAFAGPSAIYAGTYRKGLVKSTDGGSTWSQVPIGSLQGDRISDVAVHPDDPSVLYLCDDTDNQFYRVENDSVITAIGTGLGGVPYHVIISGNHDGNKNNDIIYAAKGSVFRSTNSGISFVNISLNLPLTLPVMNLSMSLVDPNFLFAHSAQDPRLFYTHNALSEVPTWTRPLSADDKNNQGEWVFGSLWDIGDAASEADYWCSPIAPHPTNKNIALNQAEGDTVGKTMDGGLIGDIRPRVTME